MLIYRITVNNTVCDIALSACDISECSVEDDCKRIVSDNDLTPVNVPELGCDIIAFRGSNNDITNSKPSLVLYSASAKAVVDIVYGDVVIVGYDANTDAPHSMHYFQELTVKNTFRSNKKHKYVYRGINNELLVAKVFSVRVP